MSIRSPFDPARPFAVHCTRTDTDGSVVREYDVVSAYSTTSGPPQPIRVIPIEDDDEVTQPYSSIPSFRTETRNEIIPRSRPEAITMSSEYGTPFTRPAFRFTDHAIRLTALCALIALAWNLSWSHTVFVFLATAALVLFARKGNPS